MRGASIISCLAWLTLGCSGAETDASPSTRDDRAPNGTQTPAAAPDQTAVESLSPTLVVFADPDTGSTTVDVYDATRDIVRFDAERRTMISAATGDAISGWTTNGNDLGPSGSFRVRFGSEGGQPRAYFTEAGNGTICDLVLRGPEMLSIFATSERPPRN